MYHLILNLVFYGWPSLLWFAVMGVCCVITTYFSRQMAMKIELEPIEIGQELEMSEL